MSTTVFPKAEVRFVAGEQTIELLRCSERENPEYAVLASSPERPFWPKIHISVQRSGAQEEPWTVFKGHPVQASALAVAIERFEGDPFGDSPPLKIWFGDHQVLLNYDEGSFFVMKFPSEILRFRSYEREIFVHALKQLAQLPVSGEAS